MPQINMPPWQFNTITPQAQAPISQFNPGNMMDLFNANATTIADMYRDSGGGIYGLSPGLKILTSKLIGSAKDKGNWINNYILTTNQGQMYASIPQNIPTALNGNSYVPVTFYGGSNYGDGSDSTWNKMLNLFLNPSKPAPAPAPAPAAPVIPAAPKIPQQPYAYSDALGAPSKRIFPIGLGPPPDNPLYSTLSGLHPYT